MARAYQCFKSVAERNKWEKEQAEKSEHFHVCFHLTVKQLCKDLPYLREEELKEYKTVTVYTHDWHR
jgi:hypothetical protein